jgi:hypothetical protein
MFGLGYNLFGELLVHRLISVSHVLYDTDVGFVHLVSVAVDEPSLQLDQMQNIFTNQSSDTIESHLSSVFSCRLEFLVAVASMSARQES